MVVTLAIRLRVFSDMKKNLPFRSWFYFRTGYSQYFAFLLALGNMFTLTYYLAITKNPALNELFPSFSSYVIISAIIGIPILTFIGFIHMKRSHAYSSEQDVSAEAQPYNYKLPPGIMKECIVPLYLQILSLNKSLFTNEKISDDEVNKLLDLEKKLELLNSGASLPKPTKFDEIN
jgi:hypothetical protein